MIIPGDMHELEEEMLQCFPFMAPEPEFVGKDTAPPTPADTGNSAGDSDVTSGGRQTIADLAVKVLKEVDYTCLAVS